MKKHFILAIETGGTKIQLVLGSDKGEIFYRYRTCVEREKGFEGILDRVTEALPSLIKKAAELGGTICRIGIGFGGPVQTSTGTAIWSAQIDGWGNFPVAQYFEEKTGIPVVGVVPMTPLDLDDEDSLSERLNRRGDEGAVDIAVIHLPHISNFTDFNVFEGMKGVSLRYVKQAGDLGKPDLIFLPGTKNTMSDLCWLRESGLEAAILRQAEIRTPVVGICGGYQMLGEQLEDPKGVEQGGSMRGMGLLNARTVFLPDKTRTQVSGRVIWDRDGADSAEGKEVRGYEIHMGRTTSLGGCRETIRLEDGRVDGLCNERGTVFGTYLHGIFDFGDLAALAAVRLMRKKGLDPGSWHFDPEAHKQQEYDKLADLVRSSLDMDKIYEILEAGIRC